MAFRTTNFLFFFFFEISNFNAPPKIPCIHFGEWLFWTYLHKIKSWRRECVLKNPLRWTQAPQIHSMPRSATGYPCPTPPPSIEANVPGWRDIVAYKRGRGVKNFEKNALIQVFVSKSWKGRLRRKITCFFDRRSLQSSRKVKFSKKFHWKSKKKKYFF